jgi:hypothetical protein
VEIPWNSSKIKKIGRVFNKTNKSESISTAATMDQSTISYDSYLSTHVFTKVNIDAPKTTYNIWIGVSQVFLPTFWCSKCNSWSSHHDKIHDERIRWQNMKDAQVAKQAEYRKQTQQSHYGPPQLQDRTYGRNDNNKRSNTTYSRDNYQDKRSRNDRGQSPSRVLSNSHTRSPRSTGDNQRNGAIFYDDKNKY